MGRGIRFNFFKQAGIQILNIGFGVVPVLFVNPGVQMLPEISLKLRRATDIIPYFSSPIDKGLSSWM